MDSPKPCGISDKDTLQSTYILYDYYLYMPNSILISATLGSPFRTDVFAIAVQVGRYLRYICIPAVSKLYM